MFYESILDEIVLLLPITTYTKNNFNNFAEWSIRSTAVIFAIICQRLRVPIVQRKQDTCFMCGNNTRVVHGNFSRKTFVQPYHSKGLGESFPLMWLNTGISLKITKLP